ncbi:GH25 family lysozyme [Curtobacterium sp. Leaf261]|uniref:GH25 family lysozyme n=1 Tax=Curtobacterium sp. Leaf261 TaxID=1736311 RepID=UPI000AEF6A74|nr:GH25 family lysozyme [Curtobacterium sp. Leaf261]
MQPRTKVGLAAVATTICATIALTVGPANAVTLSAPEVATAASPTPTATPSTSATASPSATPSSSTTASPSAAPTTAPSASTPSASTEDTTTDPTLAEQNAAGNHEMGSTIPKEAATVTRPLLRAAVAQGSVPGIPGIDISAWQTGVNWQSVANSGTKFAYIKASESTTYTSSQFSQQYQGSYKVGMIRGAYHFAVPNKSSGATQANFFMNNGGGWSGDGQTLPPLLDIEYNPYSGSDGTNTCYGLSQGAMVQWISDFSNTMKARTGIWPAIYTTTDWWRTCTGNNAAFGSNPLFIARYPAALSSGAGTLPAAWSKYALWQYSSSGSVPGIGGNVDLDTFNGTANGLSQLARTGNAESATVTPAPPATPPVLPNATTSLSAVGTFYGGQQLASSNKQYTMNMQADGNLVVYGNGRALWSTGTSRNPGSTVVMQADGNFVLYNASGRALWSSGTSRSGATKVSIQDDGDLAITADSSVKWHSGAPGADSAVPGTKFIAGQYLHSPNGAKRVVLQSDGNFVLYSGDRAIWSTGTSRTGSGARIDLQTDGNVVLYNASNTAIWSTGTSRSAANRLVVQNDGNMVLYRGAVAIWSTGTSNR